MRTRSPTARLRDVLDLPEERSSCPALLDAARDVSLDVARNALRRLERLGSDAEAAVLRQRLFEVDIGIVPDYAATLRRLGDEPSVEAAVEALASDRTTVRSVACIVLREFGAERARGPLIAALDDQIGAVRRLALEALAGLGRDGETAAACRPLLRDVDPAVRRAAIAAIAAIAQDPSPLLEETAGDADSSVRRALASEAAALEDALVGRLLRDRDPGVRAEALSQLEHNPRASLLPLVRTTLDDPSWHVRRAAARAIRGASDERASPLLVQRLDDESGVVRAEVRWTLAELFGPRLPTVVAAELAGGRPAVRRVLVYLLAECCLAEAADTIAKLERDPDPGVRIAVAKALARVEGEAARQVVERLRDDPSGDVRNAVAVALEDAGAKPRDRS
jgi:HEAT repeat protein